MPDIDFKLDGEPGTVTAMSHGLDGWTLDDPDGDNYWLWAPMKGRNDNHWTACWKANDGRDGKTLCGATSGDVLGIFPLPVREQFERAIAGAA